VGPENWSLKIPVAMEELLEHKINDKIKERVRAARR
jgi:hypothetical protein